MRILIVDDNDCHQEILIRFLESQGRCETLDEGSRVVEVIEAALDMEDPYTLICLDITMPEIDGHEVLRQIRKFERDKDLTPKLCPVVLITSGRNDNQAVMEALQAGCDGYLIKPFNRKRLFEELAKCGIGLAL